MSWNVFECSPVKKLVQRGWDVVFFSFIVFFGIFSWPSVIQCPAFLYKLSEVALNRKLCPIVKLDHERIARLIGNRFHDTKQRHSHWAYMFPKEQCHIVFTSHLLPEGASEPGGKSTEPCGGNCIRMDHPYHGCSGKSRSTERMTPACLPGAEHSTCKQRRHPTCLSMFFLGSCRTHWRDLCQLGDIFPLRACTWCPLQRPRRKRAETKWSSSSKRL